MAEEFTNHQTEEELAADAPAENEQTEAAALEEMENGEIADIDFDAYDEYEDENEDEEDEPMRLRDRRILRMRAPIFYGVVIGIAVGMMMTAIPFFYNDRLTTEIVGGCIGYLVGKRCCGFPIFKSMKDCEADLEEQKILERKERRVAREAAKEQNSSNEE